jgi:hypothetical protein
MFLESTEFLKSAKFSESALFRKVCNVYVLNFHMIINDVQILGFDR